MPRLIIKCHHIRPKQSQKERRHMARYVRYMGERDGTKKQEQEPKLEEQQNRGGYLEYMAKRIHSHGLFGCTDVTNISKLADALSQHEGVVWTPILSLKREDAEKVGFDKPEAWAGLLTTKAAEIAEAFKIPLENLRWYAAYHDKEENPHCHMVVYSTNPKEGFLTEPAIRELRSVLTQAVFRAELTGLYVEETAARDELVRGSREAVDALCQRLSNKQCGNQAIADLLLELRERLSKCKGKKVYGYLPPDVKKLVDRVVDELSKDEDVTRLHRIWFEKRCEIWRTYKDEVPEQRPLSDQPEFKSIKNAVIKAALGLEPDIVLSEKSSDSIVDENGFSLPEVSDTEPSDTEPSDTEPSDTASAAFLNGNSTTEFQQEEWQRQCAARQATSLLRSLAKLFGNDALPELDRQSERLRGRVDRKRLRVLTKKKQSQGQAEQDYDGQAQSL